MLRSSLLCAILVGTVFTTQAQCTVDLPADTVTLYRGYAPQACASLTPLVYGSAPTALLWSNGSNSTSIQVCDTVSGWYFVTLTDDTACTATDSVFVHVVDVRCGNNWNKVLVCHIPPGNPANAHTICISENGVPAHLAHGCYLGACDPAPDSIQNGGGSVQLEASPNPMSVVTSVEVHSMVAQQVTVAVFDANGRRLLVLFDATMSGGEARTLPLDRSQLPQSISLIWIEARGGTDRAVQRIAVVR